jgi:hypothetical protein
MKQAERDRYVHEQVRLKRIVAHLRRKARDPSVTLEERAALQTKMRELRARLR